MFIKPILPELIVLAAAVAAVLSQTSPRKAARIVLTGFILAVVAVLSLKGQRLTFQDGLLVSDAFSVTIKSMLLVSAAFSVMFGADWLAYKRFSRGEYAALLAFSVAGAMIAVSANSFLTLFLGLEAMQTPLTFLTAYKRHGERSTEAGVKAVMTALTASGLLLFGVSVIYVCLGTVDFAEIASADKTAAMSALTVGVSFVTAGFFIKAGVPPFHLGLPDVYEGAPAPVTAFYGTAVRLGVLSAFARVVVVPFGDMGFYWKPVLEAAAVLSVYGGALGLLVQTNIKRFAAYAVVMTNGVAVAAAALGGFAAFVLFIGINTVLLTGLFAVMLSLRVGGDLSEELKVLKGQGRANAERGALYSLVFLGLLGLPPLAGFWAYFAVWKAGFESGAAVVVVLLAIGNILPAYVFLKIVRQMYFFDPSDELSPAPEPMKIAIVSSAAISVFLPFFLGGVGHLIEQTVW